MGSAQLHESSDEGRESAHAADGQMAMEWMMRWSVAANANRRMMEQANSIVKNRGANEGEVAIQIMAAGEYHDTESVTAMRAQMLRELAEEIRAIGRGQVSTDWLRRWLLRRASDALKG